MTNTKEGMKEIWDWKEEFREYFDKTLKPKKPTIGGLDRELCIDFINRVLASREREIVEEIEAADWENDSKPVEEEKKDLPDLPEEITTGSETSLFKIINNQNAIIRYIKERNI